MGVAYLTAYGLDEDDAADAFVSKVAETRTWQRRALQKSKPAEKAPSMSRVVSKMASLLHSHPCHEQRRRWLKLDVDTKDSALVERLQHCLKGAAIIFAAETRGGYHVLFEKGPWCRELYDLERNVNENVPNKEDRWITIEANNGPMIAIPGTNQGGFLVRSATESWRRAVDA